jgi:hypothetical protein
MIMQKWLLNACRKPRFWFVLILGLFLGSPSAHAGVVIQINFDGGLTSSQQAYFSFAASYWQSLIVDYAGGTNPLFSSGIDDMDGRIDITAKGIAIDGVGGVLGQAGPQTAARLGGFLYTATGIMQFDSADLGSMESNKTLMSVIMHEMAHVLGFGTLWDPATDFGFEGYQDVFNHTTNAYTGANALGQWKTEFSQSSATFVPVEADGGAGTAKSHWNEVAGGAGLTGITDTLGRDMRNELMTGWLNAPSFLSRMSVAQFADIGYVVDFTNLAFVNSNLNKAVVPEPSSMLIFAMGAFAFAKTKSRKVKS